MRKNELIGHHEIVVFVWKPAVVQTTALEHLVADVSAVNQATPQGTCAAPETQIEASCD